MKFHKILIFAILLSIGSAQTLLAYSSDDYYKAGVQLYSAKNYDWAIKYFGASLSLDPNNASALLVRGNCYYVLGQYQQALDDYQRVLTINPSNTQLANFVDRIKAKIGGVSNSNSAFNAPNSDNAFSQGVALYRQKQYSQAASYFEQATQQDPKNAKIYYYLGVTQLMLGDQKDATLNLALSNELQPNPAVAAYVKKLKAELSSDDQRWVEVNLSGWSGHENTTTSSEDSKIVGLRLEPAIAFVALGDFNTNDETRVAIGKYLQQNGDPSFQFSGTVPSGYPDITFEPTLKVLPFLEIGLPLTAMLVGNDSYIEQDSSASYNVAYSFSSYAVGLNARIFYGDGPVKLFFAGGPVIVPVSMTYNENDTFVSSAPITYSGTTSSTAIGAQCQLGADYHLGGGLLLSAYIGYRAASASGFTGNVTASEGGASTSLPGQYYVISTTYGNEILFVPNSNISSYPSGSYRPLVVDLSSILAGIQLSVYF